MLPIFITVHEHGKERRLNVALIRSYGSRAGGGTLIFSSPDEESDVTETPEEIDALIEQAKNAERDYLLAALDDLRIALEGRK